MSPTPAAFSLAKEAEGAQTKSETQDGVHEQISAADYDPSLDRREDEQKRVFGVKEEPAEDLEVVEEEEEEDVDDMFAIATTEKKKKTKKVKKVVVSILLHSFSQCLISMSLLRNLSLPH